MRIMLDPGHGGNDPGAQANGIREKDPNLKVALRAAAMLEAHGMDVLLTRTGDVTVSLPDRTDFANREKVDAFISIHHNAADNSSARGLEVYHSIFGGEGKRLARLIHDRFVAITGIPSRGVRTRKGSSGRDYYHVIRETRMPAVIVEGGFVTNPEDAALIKSAAFIEQEAQAISQAVLAWYGHEVDGLGTPILGKPQATLEQAQAWARTRKASDDFIAVAGLYWKLAPTLNVRPEVAYAQSAKETAFGRFGGVITRDFNNWCGLKTTKGGSNSDPNAHARFPDDRTGVLAHLQHLALYAGQTVTGKIVDPRHFSSIEGTAKTVEALGGRWAPSKDYGQSIVWDYLTPLLKTKVAEPEPKPQPEPPKTVSLEEYERVVQERDEYRAKLERIKAIVG